MTKTKYRYIMCQDCGEPFEITPYCLNCRPNYRHDDYRICEFCGSETSISNLECSYCGEFTVIF